MANDTLKTFPSDKESALAFLYVKSQDLTGKSPEEILDMYDDAYEKISTHEKNKYPESDFTVQVG